MQIEIMKVARGPNVNHNPGDIVEMDEASASTYIVAGAGRHVVAEEAAPIEKRPDAPAEQIRKAVEPAPDNAAIKTGPARGGKRRN